MTTTLRIAHEDWEKMATASLEGMIIENGKHFENLSPNTEIILEIEQTPLWWREKNGGPNVLIMQEYTPMCIIESIINLMDKGHKITVREVLQEMPLPLAARKEPTE